jgi:hypothetical protein
MVSDVAEQLSRLVAETPPCRTKNWVFATDETFTLI